MSDKDTIWLVMMQREDKNIHDGFRLSQAFDNRKAAEEYKAQKEEKEDIEFTQVITRGIYSENQW